MTKMSDKRHFGIDLGTTNSVVGLLHGTNAIIIPNQDGFRTTPSVVTYPRTQTDLKNTKPIVGLFAKRQNILNPLNTFYSTKRFIGRKYEDILDEISRVSYTIKKGLDGNIQFYCPLLEQEFSPEEISAIIIKQLAFESCKFLNVSISAAIITVPAYFNDSQRLATQDAAKIAGLKISRILNEPTAAALAYGLDKKKNEIILIFDLGGGTFDVSILEVGDSIFEVLATTGDTHLGGDDYDKIIVDFIVKKFLDEYEVDLKKIDSAFQRVIEAAEKAKIDLSTADSTIINLPFIYRKENEKFPINFSIELSRTLFENLVKHLVLKCKDPVMNAIIEAKIQINDLDEIVLVGGSTRIPAVKEVIKSLISKTLNDTVNPDEVVALGAAIQAGVISGEISDLILLDVTPLSLGVETEGEIMVKIIPRNSSIPIKRVETFSTVADFQDTVEIHILQGERDLAKFNKSLGLFELKGISKAPKGIPQINVTFDINSDGLLCVSACEEGTGVQQSINIKGASTLSKNEIAEMLKDAADNIDEDTFFVEYIFLADILKDLSNFINYIFRKFVLFKYMLINILEMFFHNNLTLNRLQNLLLYVEYFETYYIHEFMIIYFRNVIYNLRSFKSLMHNIMYYIQ